jgi:hypothetical protein
MSLLWGAGFSRYQDLSAYMLSIPGKIQICEYYDGLEKSSRPSVQEFSCHHKIKRSTFHDALMKYRKLNDTKVNEFHRTRGRPALLDSPAKGRLTAALMAKKKAQNSQKNTGFCELIREHIEKAHDINGVAGASFKVHRNTVANIKKSIKADVVACQHKTAARVFAESDMRNNYTMAVMLFAFTRGLVPYMIFNWDATQYSIIEDSDNRAVVVKIEGDAQPVTAQSAGTIAISIKHFHFHNAAGEVAPPVFLISDDSLGPDDFPQPIKVGDLGATSDISAFGWLCFTKTRNGNNAFYNWYATEVVVPFITQVREKHADVCKVHL